MTCERCWIDPVDTPFVIDSVRIARRDASDDERAAIGVTLVLPGGIEEPLDPESLSVGKDNVLYTSVREGAFPARFSRKAYYELARCVVPSGEGFALVVGGREHPIANA